MGARHRQPVSAQSDGHGRHHQRDRTRQRRLHRLRRLHPDRRGDQPGKFGRRAGQHARRARRHQHGHLQPERRLSGHRLRRAEQPRQARRRRSDEVRQRAPRHHRDGGVRASDTETCRRGWRSRVPTAHSSSRCSATLRRMRRASARAMSSSPSTGRTSRRHPSCTASLRMPRSARLRCLAFSAVAASLEIRIAIGDSSRRADGR